MDKNLRLKKQASQNRKILNQNNQDRAARRARKNARRMARKSMGKQTRGERNELRKLKNGFRPHRETIVQALAYPPTGEGIMSPGRSFGTFVVASFGNNGVWSF
ncbi:MAG: hypothetical protein WC445_04785 [Patescibacteria group bacterium]